MAASGEACGTRGYTILFLSLLIESHLCGPDTPVRREFVSVLQTTVESSQTAELGLNSTKAKVKCLGEGVS